jgi:hypothetical protein
MIIVEIVPIGNTFWTFGPNFTSIGRRIWLSCLIGSRCCEPQWLGRRALCGSTHLTGYSIVSDPILDQCGLSQLGSDKLTSYWKIFSIMDDWIKLSTMDWQIFGNILLLDIFPNECHNSDWLF